MKKRLLILSVSAGAGHLRAAEALRETANTLYPDVEAVHLDVMNYVTALFRKAYADSYMKIVESHPEIWGYLYSRTDRQETPDSKLRRIRLTIERLNTRKLMKKIREINPDFIICTHFLPAELISRLIEKNQMHTPCWVQVTDFDVHYFWVHSYMHGYFVASEDVAYRLAYRGIPASNIYITGIPIMPAFTKTYDRIECAQELGIDPHRKTITLISGGVEGGRIHELAQSILQIPGDFQIIAIAKKNQEIFEKLQKIATEYPGRLKPIFFSTTMERIMATSDIAITKPGGLTSCECLAMGLPMLIISPIPGQEERNADYLLENGVAWKAHDLPGVIYRIQKLLKEPHLLTQMRQKAQQIAKPYAAQQVLDLVLKRSSDIIHNGFV